MGVTLLKSCYIKSPRIKEAKTQREESSEINEIWDFNLYIEMGSNREINKEYFIYDTLSLIGTIGGTLGLFVGFSFYDFLVMIVHFVLKKIQALMSNKRLNHDNVKNLSDQQPRMYENAFH